MRRPSSRLAAPVLALALGAGGRAASASDPPPAPPAPAPAPSALMYDPDFREGKPDDVLAEAAPALRRGDLDAFVDLFEAAYDLSLTPEEEQAYRDAVESGWPAWDPTAREGARRRADERAAVVAALAKGDAAGAKRLLDAFASEQDARLSAAPTAAYHRPLIDAKKRRADTFSAGSPAVTVAAQDAFEDLALFLVRVARNEDAPVTEGQRLALRDRTRATFDATGEAVRRHYARMPRLWRLVKARWEVADDAAKLRMRWAAVHAFRWFVGLSPSQRPPPGPDGDLVAYAAAAREIAAKGLAYDQYTQAFQNPQALLAAAVAGLGVADADLESAFAHDPLTVK